MSKISPGISMVGCGENSCSISSIGKSGARSCGVNGAWVPGWRGGAMGSGSDGRTLTHTVGIWLSASRNLECSDMGELTISTRAFGRDTMLTVNRRSFLAVAGASVTAATAASDVPVIDTHIHLFDPTR